MSDSEPEQDLGTAPPDDLPEALPPHTIVGEFEITGIIGEGGFGTVYLAHDHSLDRQVALKEYRPAALATRQGKRTVTLRSQRYAEAFDAGLRSFINEARTLAKFDHPALVKVFRFWQENNTAYMAMPLYQGRTLKEVVLEQPQIVTEPWLKSLLSPLFDAVEALHEVQIFHRDISPDNILILDNGAPVLLDFGAARQIAVDRSQPLTVIIKSGYAPVEQYAEDPTMKQGPWTDIYALAAVVYFAITKHPPPNSVSRFVNDSLPLAQIATSEYSRKFILGIEAGLAPRPEGRPQSIADFRRVLGVVSHAPTPRTRVPTMAPSMSGPPTISPVTQGRSGTTPNPDATVAVLRKSKAPESQPSKPPPVAPPKPAPKPQTQAQTQPSNKNLMRAIAAVIVALAIGGGLWVKFRPHAPAQSTAALPAPAAPSESIPPPPPVGPSPVPAPSTASAPTPTPAAPVPPATATTSVPASPAAPTTAATPVPSTASKSTATPSAATTPAPAAATTTAAAANSDSSTPSAAASAPGMGSLRIDVKPWGEVFVDGTSKGVSPPLKKLSLPEGKHKIEIKNAGFADYSNDTQIQKNHPVTITHQFK